MTMARVVSGRAVGAIALLLWLGAVDASAQDVGTKAGESLPGGGSTRDLTRPGAGGVAGTGLGRSTDGTGGGRSGEAPGSPGTGMSVKGPPGQGLDGQGISNGIGSAGGTGP